MLIHSLPIWTTGTSQIWNDMDGLCTSVSGRRHTRIQRQRHELAPVQKSDRVPAALRLYLRLDIQPHFDVLPLTHISPVVELKTTAISTTPHLEALRPFSEGQDVSITSPYPSSNRRSRPSLSVSETTCMRAYAECPAALEALRFQGASSHVALPGGHGEARGSNRSS